MVLVANWSVKRLEIPHKHQGRNCLGMKGGDNTTEIPRILLVNETENTEKASTSLRHRGTVKPFKPQWSGNVVSYFSHGL